MRKRPPKQLRSTKAVIEALGGPEQVCKLTGANKKQAWNWHGRAGIFPAAYYVVMIRALQERNYEAPATLWSMKGIRRAA